MQNVEGPRGRARRPKACRNSGSAIAAEVFMNNAGLTYDAVFDPPQHRLNNLATEVGIKEIYWSRPVQDSMRPGKPRGNFCFRTKDLRGVPQNSGYSSEPIGFLRGKTLFLLAPSHSPG